MSPEMLDILFMLKDPINFSPEKSDIFSLGLSFLRLVNLW